MDQMTAVGGILAGVIIVVVVLFVIFSVVVFFLFRYLKQIKGIMMGSNFYLMTLAQTLGDRKAATRAAMYTFKLSEIEAIQFLQLLQMEFPEDDEED